MTIRTYQYTDHMGRLRYESYVVADEHILATFGGGGGYATRKEARKAATAFVAAMNAEINS